MPFGVTLCGYRFVADEWIGVQLPKTVFVQNYRLGLIDLFLKACVIAYVLANLFLVGDDIDVISEAYAPTSVISYWAESGSYVADVQADLKKDMCDSTKNRKYDYGYGSGWVYDNHGCTWLHKNDRAFKLQDVLFVPTYSQTSYEIQRTGAKVADGGSCSAADCDPLVIGACTLNSKGWQSELFDEKGNCICTCTKSHNEFTVGMEGVELHFLHLPQWPTQTRPFIEQQGLPTMPKNQYEVHKEEMVTIIRDANKQELRRFNTDEEVWITVGEIMRMGDSHSFDKTYKVDNLKNYLVGLAGVDQTGLEVNPHLRVTGATVNLMVSYHNGNSDQNKHGEDVKGVVCYIDVEIIPRWTGFPIGDNDDVEFNGAKVQAIRERYLYGLKIRFVTSGKFEFFSLNKLLTYLASAIVYLTVPNFLMVLFTKFCLGTLSEMYYKAQCTLLDFWELFSGQVVRALIGLYCYNHIAARGEKSGKSSSSVGSGEGSPKNRVLDKAFLHECLVDLFEEHDGLDDSEIDTIQKVLTKVLDKEGNQSVAQQAFVEAAVNADVGNMKGWAALFDKDRRGHCLERMFDTTIADRRAVTKKATEDSPGGGANVSVEVKPKEGEATPSAPAVAPAAGEDKPKEEPTAAPAEDKPKEDDNGATI